MALSVGKYKTVVVDAPWPVQGYAHPEDAEFNHGLEKHVSYDVMTMEDITSFDIDRFADEKCLLFFWSTTGKTQCGKIILEESFKIIKEWGFVYRAMLYWQKNGGIPKPFLPYQTTVEPILFCTRGIAQVPPYGGFKDIFEASRGAHSEKPAKFYQLLRGWTPKPRIDIFARRAHEGFDGWGNEYVGNSDEGTLMEWMK